MNEIFLYNLVGYFLITSTGNCGHPNDDPTSFNESERSATCFSEHAASSQSECAAFCTSMTTCVGYTWAIINHAQNYCKLIQSNAIDTCPSTFSLTRGTLATTGSDLVPRYEDPRFSCYGNSGEINKSQIAILCLSDIFT